MLYVLGWWLSGRKWIMTEVNNFCRICSNLDRWCKNYIKVSQEWASNYLFQQNTNSQSNDIYLSGWSGNASPKVTKFLGDMMVVSSVARVTGTVGICVKYVIMSEYHKETLFLMKINSKLKFFDSGRISSLP